jgi:hypothetical protein
MRRLHRRGVNVQCLGFDSYLLAIVLFTFSIEEVDLFAGGSVPLPAREGETGITDLIACLSLGVSKNQPALRRRQARSGERSSGKPILRAAGP